MSVSQIETVLPYLKTALFRINIRIPAQSTNGNTELFEPENIKARTAAMNLYRLSIETALSNKSFLANPKKFADEWYEEWRNSEKGDPTDIYTQVEGISVKAFKDYVSFYLDKTAEFYDKVDQFCKKPHFNLHDDEIKIVKNTVFSYKFLQDPIKHIDTGRKDRGYTEEITDGDRIDNVICDIAGRHLGWKWTPID